MDRSDKKTSEFERRASRRLSRGVSVHAGADAPDAVDDDAYLAAMAMTVSDGFRPYTETTAPSAGTPLATHTNAKDDRRHSVSNARHDDEQLSTMTVPGDAASSTSADTYSSSSSPSSSSDYSSPSNVFATTSPSQPSNVPIPTPQPQESTSLPTPAPSSLSSLQRSITAARPSSIAKPPIGHISRSAPSEGTSGSSSNARPVADVRSSASSSVAPAHEEEPYQGPSGPSFPYQMYPQNVRMARSLSGVTTSTIAPSDSSYTGPRGPTFPYGLYPQNTVAGPSAMPVPGISVGFPGMADNYQRRIGPDGEDAADLIGPDGHTEQLPPYTRYPDEAYSRKIAAANAQPHHDPLADPLADAPADRMAAPNTAPVAVPAAAPDPASAEPILPTPEPASTSAYVAVPAPIQLIPGAGGIGLASHNPEFDGVEDAESPRSRYSLRSFNSEGSRHEINTAARNISEKHKHRPPHFIQRYGGRRILGVIPYWAICLVITALLLMGIILGSVVGTFVARHRRAQELHHPNNNSPMSVTVTVDATPIPTPANLPSLPTGTFGLPFQINESPGACFNDTTQAQAWKCSIANQYSMTLTINSLPSTPNGPMFDISINCNESATYENNLFFYGEQAPTISTRTALQLVNDTLDPNRGPAWFKMMPYNKTVIVRESFLSVPNSQPTSSASSSNNNKRDSGDLTGSLSFAAAGPFGRKGAMPAQAGDKPWVCTWPDTILEVFIYPNQNTSMYKISLSSTYTPVTTTPTSTSSTSTYSGMSIDGAPVTTTDTSATVASATPTQFPNAPPPYPRVVKMEERRMANSPQATCVQYQLKPEGTGLKAVPNLDANGHPIQITIAEIESGPSLFSQGKRDIMGADEIFEKRDESGLSKCGCLWMVT